MKSLTKRTPTEHIEKAAMSAVTKAATSNGSAPGALPTIIPKNVTAAYEKAKQTRLMAYAPYSGFSVGAALLSGKNIITGCNVENASYGGTVCAERTAILKAVSEGESKFSDIVVVTDTPEPAFPCAFCLQVMAEFFSSGTLIWLGDLSRLRSVHQFEELLPHPFGPRQLKNAKTNKRR